jgi:hypothetical protein
MGCDYYIQSEFVIEFIDKSGKISFIYTNRGLKKGYIFNYNDQDSDDDEETAFQKYDQEIENKIRKNTYNKMLFEDNTWVKDSYRKKYEERFKRDFIQIKDFIKIYKKFTAWKRN